MGDAAGLLRPLDAEFGPFDLDPCATPENALCARFFTKADDGLAQTWTGAAFMNPPYSDLDPWMAKAWEAAQTTAELVVCLVPARTGSRWWHKYAERGKYRFLAKRLRFGGAKNVAPFDSAVVVFRNWASVTKPVRLLPAAVSDAALRRHLETTHFFDEVSGELYDPTTPPVIAGWGQDDDEDEDEVGRRGARGARGHPDPGDSSSEPPEAAPGTPARPEGGADSDRRIKPSGRSATLRNHRT